MTFSPCNRKAVIAAVLLMCVCLSALNAGHSRFELSDRTDITLSVSAAALLGLDIIIEKSQSTPAYGGAPSIALDELNALDALAVCRYSRTIDTASSVSVLAMMAAAGGHAFFAGEDSLVTGVMYLETLAWAFAVKELGKNLVHRERPYVYNDGYPADEVDNGDYIRSFPSGHSTLAFASAAFLSAAMEDSEWKLPVVAGSYALAAGIAAMRVVSGNHHITDVLAGAAIGMACGYLIPLVHRLPGLHGNGAGGASVSAALLPDGFCAAMSF